LTGEVGAIQLCSLSTLTEPVKNEAAVDGGTLKSLACFSRGANERERSNLWNI